MVKQYIKAFTLPRRCGVVTKIILAAGFLLCAGTSAVRADNALEPAAILAVMQRVADWQLANPATNPPAGWVQAAGDAGMMALAGISGDAKYRDAMLALGETNRWQLGPRKYHADDQCIGQTYAELYFLYREPKMIVPMRARFDDILANPPATTNLDFSQKGHGQELWSWCDSLFMAPPAWLRLYAATGDEKYLNFAVTNWWRTTDFLYDTNEHLFFRNSTYFSKKEANGEKVFWARGNGWVMAGLIRTLQYLPMNHPDRPRFEQLFKDMAEKILTCQQPDGLWRASLLDPASYPLKETSGSGFFTYALAWGVNQGLLDRAKFEPAVQKAWTALVGCVDADGKLTNVQPVGADPKNFTADSTEPYGVGAFLLAGSEVYRMAVFDKTREFLPSDLNATFINERPRVLPLRIPVKITNPSLFYRDCETIELDVNLNPPEVNPTNGLPVGIDGLFLMSGSHVTVMDSVSSRIMDSQIVSSHHDWGKASMDLADKLLFQVDLAPGEARTFYILDASALAAVPPPIVKTFARYVPERHDDIAWESDRIAHRMYGPALETWQAEPLTSSGYDVWVKRTRGLIVNPMYATMNFFDTDGPAQDDYRVGKLRGCGGLGVWQDGKLYVSKNWRTCKIITTGPVRSEFELTYDAWDAGGRKISEIKRISIDAGSNMSRVESTFSSDDKSPLEIGVGLAERPGENTFCGRRFAEIDSWQSGTTKDWSCKIKRLAGKLTGSRRILPKAIGAAFVLPKGSVETFTNDIPDLPAANWPRRRTR